LSLRTKWHEDALMRAVKRDCKSDARWLLLDHNKVVSKDRIIRVDPDAILYVDENKKPHTAWLTYNRHTKETAVTVVDGFPAWPESPTPTGSPPAS
jgi:hypothetical protein